MLLLTAAEVEKGQRRACQAHRACKLHMAVVWGSTVSVHTYTHICVWICIHISVHKHTYTIWNEIDEILFLLYVLIYSGCSNATGRQDCRIELTLNSAKALTKIRITPRHAPKIPEGRQAAWIDAR